MQAIRVTSWADSKELPNYSNWGGKSVPMLRLSQEATIPSGKFSLTKFEKKKQHFAADDSSGAAWKEGGDIRKRGGIGIRGPALMGKRFRVFFWDRFNDSECTKHRPVA